MGLVLEILVTDREEIVGLLKEIRDNQRLSLQHQTDHIELTKQQLERARTQVQESLELQRTAIARVKQVSLIAIPGIALCLALIVYLVVKYF
jgi:hypothetical protein